jgi:hypothetical protein
LRQTGSEGDRAFAGGACHEDCPRGRPGGRHRALAHHQPGLGKALQEVGGAEELVRQCAVMTKLVGQQDRLLERFKV